MSWPYFSDNELKCRCGCGQSKMNNDFMKKVVALRKQAAFPFIITSAYRCPHHNETLGATGRQGPHTTGRAIDIKASGAQAYKLLQHAAEFGFTGIGVKQVGSHNGRFIHLDDLTPKDGFTRPWVWGY